MTYFTATSNISQLQALATGICCFPVPNMASQGAPGGVFEHLVLLKNVMLNISEKFHFLLKYTLLDDVSICVFKMFYFEN